MRKKFEECLTIYTNTGTVAGTVNYGELVGYSEKITIN